MAVYTFSDPDPHVLEVSYRTLRLYTYLGVNGIQIIDAKWITDVIGMVPFKDTQRETNFLEGKEYFAVEKISTVFIRKDDTDNPEEE